MIEWFAITAIGMVAMLAGPPEDPALGRALRDKGQDEAEDSARFEPSVRKVAVVADRHTHHAHDIKCDCDHEISQVNAGPDGGDACKMGEDEWNRLDAAHEHAWIQPRPAIKKFHVDPGAGGLSD